MKNSILRIHAIALLVFTLSCEKNNDSDLQITDGFNLVINDSIIYNSNSIDFYDFSSHLIYLKAGHDFSFSNRGVFSILVDNKEIYTGEMYPMYSSHLPSGPYIRCVPTLYNDYIIPIRFIQKIDQEGNSIVDPRNDPGIIAALKKYNQYREGLSCEIISVQKIINHKIQITLSLTNRESENLLYLDPDKMGPELFHYFTNGLIIRDSKNNFYVHKLTPHKPDPWNSWSADWLSVIHGNETKTISIFYTDFDFLPSGEYTASFSYPGLSYQVAKEELEQHNGRIWLGELNSTRIIAMQ